RYSDATARLDVLYVAASSASLTRMRAVMFDKNLEEKVMARKNARTDVSRRKFLAGVAVAGAAGAVPVVQGAKAADADTAAFVKRPSSAAAEAELGTPNVSGGEGTLSGPAGSDFMVDVLRSLEIDFVFSNPASSCRGIHESIVNYGGNKKPEFITCMHEES